MKLNIKGPIVSTNDKWFYDWMEMEATAPCDVILPDSGEPIEVIINSGGGDVYAGSEIYTALRDYPGQVTVKIVGIAASAASVIAMAGDVVAISPTAQIMIHNVSTLARGDAKALAHEARVLDGYNQSIASSYVTKTGKSMDELLTLMGQETWFTAEQAVAHGFADKVMFEAEVAPVLVASQSAMVPSHVIEKLAGLKRPVSPELDMDKLAEAVAERLTKVEAVATAEPETPIDDVTPSGLGRFCF